MYNFTNGPSYSLLAIPYSATINVLLDKKIYSKLYIKYNKITDTQKTLKNWHHAYDTRSHCSKVTWLKVMVLYYRSRLAWSLCAFFVAIKALPKVSS